MKVKTNHFNFNNGDTYKIVGAWADHFGLLGDLKKGTTETIAFDLIPQVDKLDLRKR